MKTVHRTARRRAAFALAAAAATIGAALTAPAALAVGSGVAQPTVVNAVPMTATPNVTNGVVYSITKVGTQVILGGSFTAAQDYVPKGTTATTVTRTDVLAFDSATGKLTTGFAPKLDGTVQAVAPGPSAGTVYVGGFFSTVNGVKSKGITLLNTTTGAIVTGFKPPALNGAVQTIASTSSHVLIAGNFTLAGASTRLGIASLNPTTGALDSYLSVALESHHGWNGTSSTAKGPIGGRAMAVNPAGTRLMVVGNFKTADKLPRDQIVMIDLGATQATVDTNWATLSYTAACYNWAFDTYVTDVQWAPDGSYFAVTATGGQGTNSDNSYSLCDSASRWDASATGSNVQASWVDYTGTDTLWSVAVTSSAIYVGGHQRWLNNYNGRDSAGAGAVARPGLGALDPITGVPLSWNPGRNPRGAGAYALLATSNGLYVGSDTDYFGDFYYKHQKIGFFPLAGGLATASTAVASLPANVYLGGPTQSQAGVDATGLAYRPVSTTKIGPATAVPGSGLTWDTVRGAFAVGNTLFFGRTDGTFYRAPFSASGVGTATAVDPYNDPKWSTVATGSGQTYRAPVSAYYGQLSQVTGAFYANGRMYYSQSGQSALHYRYFSPDSAIIGSQEFTVAGGDFSSVSGVTASGSTVYYAAADGNLHSVSLAGGVIDPTTDVIVSGPGRDGNDWRTGNLFLYGAATFPNSPPTASATSSCAQLTCSFDGSASADSDGQVVSYSWTFGDGSTGTGATPAHGYAAAGTYHVTLTVTDDRGGVSPAWTGDVTVTAPAVPVSLVGNSTVNGSVTTASVAVPAGSAAGDTELLIVSAATNGVTTTPAGWTQIAQRTNAPLETTVFRRTAAAGDGSTVGVTLTTATRADIELAVYRGVAGSSAVTAGDTNVTFHGTPASAVAVGGSWVLSYWAVRASTATTWTPPSTVTVRATGLGGSVGGHVDGLVADSGAGVASGPYGPAFAGSGVAAAKGATVAVVLSPGA